MVRGGDRHDEPADLRSAARDYGLMDLNRYGLRVVRDIR